MQHPGVQVKRRAYGLAVGGAASLRRRAYTRFNVREIRKVQHPGVQVKRRAHSLAVRGRRVAAEARVQHRERSEIQQLAPVCLAFLRAVQPARALRQALPVRGAGQDVTDGS